jgi:hypothetical protein
MRTCSSAQLLLGLVTSSLLAIDLQKTMLPWVETLSLPRDLRCRQPAISSPALPQTGEMRLGIRIEVRDHDGDIAVLLHITALHRWEPQGTGRWLHITDVRRKGPSLDRKTGRTPGG